MRIEIDTKKDSVEDIQKTIEFLQKFVNGSGSTSYNSTGADLPSSDGVFNMFNDDSPSSSDSTASNDSDSSPQTMTYGETEKKDDDEDDNPGIIIEY